MRRGAQIGASNTAIDNWMIRRTISPSAAPVGRHWWSGSGVAVTPNKKALKRMAGQRAGMTRAKIVDAAVKLWDAAGPDGFTIRKLAAQLKVVPTTTARMLRGALAS